MKNLFTKLSLIVLMSFFVFSCNKQEEATPNQAVNTATTKATAPNGVIGTGDAQYNEFKNWYSSEPNMQSQASIDYFMQQISANNYYIWNDPIKVVKYNNKAYVVDGNHRVQAAIYLKWGGTISYQIISLNFTGFKNYTELTNSSKPFSTIMPTK